MNGPSEFLPETSPLRGRYLIQNKWFNRLFRLLDGTLNLLTGASRPLGELVRLPAKPRILFANAAHLGDVVVSTTVIARVRELHPDAVIGVVVGSWAAKVVAGHPAVDHVHIVDHWKLNRSPLSMSSKIIRYLATRRQARREIVALGYDIAFDLYFFFPNLLSLIWSCRIPARVGYTSAGFGPLLTHPHAWRLLNQPVAAYHLQLLDAIRSKPGVDRFAPDLGPRPPAYAGLSSTEPGYVLMHVGTGASMKEWPVARWREVARQLVREGHSLVFTGAGASERAMVGQIVEGLDGMTNLTDQLDWSEFVGVVANARLLVGVDSIAGHVAAAFDVPSVIISSGINAPALWRPASPVAQTLTAAVPCSPCFLSRGCQAMSCIRDVSVDDVRKAIARDVSTVEARMKRTAS